jgi:hypothetical protein
MMKENCGRTGERIGERIGERTGERIGEKELEVFFRLGGLVRRSWKSSSVWEDW